MAIVTHRILIIKTSSLGDIMHGLQVAQTLKENDPGLEITWVAREIYEPLVRTCTAVDHTYTFYRSGGISGFVSLCRRLRREEYDFVLDFQGLARSGLMTFFSRSSRKIGRTDAREGASLFCKELVPLPRSPHRRHPVDILMEFCRVFGFETRLAGKVRFVLKGAPNPGASERAVVTFLPEGRNGRNRWNGFEELATLLLEKRKTIALQVFSTQGIEWVDRLKQRFGDRFEAVTTDGLLRLVGAIQESDLVVCVDCDPAHISAAVGTETIALFGSTDPERCGPYPLSSPRNQAIKAPDGNLEQLSAAEVLKEIEKRI